MHFKRLIALAAAQPPELAKLIITQAAIGAFNAFARLLFSGLSKIRKAGEQIRQPELLLHLRAFFTRALLAQMHFRHLVVHNFRQMDRCFFLAAYVTLHSRPFLNTRRRLWRSPL